MFDAWALLIPWAPVVGFINVVLALPSALLSIRSKKWGWIAWIATLAFVVAGLIWWYLTYWSSAPFPSETPWEWIVQLSLYFLVPQAVAYPLTRKYPLLRPLLAGALGTVAVLVWALLGLATGAQSD